MRFPKPLAYFSENYRAFIRRQECFACNREAPSICHHESGGSGEQKMGGKCLDTMCLPLCGQCHELRTIMGYEFWWAIWKISQQRIFVAMLSYTARYLIEIGK